MTTKIQILLRDSQTEKTEGNHAKPVEFVPSNQVCVIDFGGTGTESPRAANGNVKQIRNTLIKYNIDVPTYSIFYEFDKKFHGDREILHDAKIASIEITQKNIKQVFNKKILNFVSDQGKKIPVEQIDKKWDKYIKIMFNKQTDKKQFEDLLQKTLIGLKYTNIEIQQIKNLIEKRTLDILDEHIIDLYNRIIMPRVSVDGKRIELTEALRQIRQITFVSHCYGSVIARKLQNETRNQMLKLDYNDIEIQEVLDQMLVVSHEPAGDLSHPSKAFINFASASDDMMINRFSWLQKFIKNNIRNDRDYMDDNHLKDIEREWFPYLRNHPSKTAIAFLPQKYGNMFLIPQGYEYEGFTLEEEHNNIGYVEPYPGRNINSVALNALARNVFIHGVENSLKQQDYFTPLPEIVDLVQGFRDDQELKKRRTIEFEEMQSIGQELVQSSFEYARENIKNMIAKRKEKYKVNIESNNTNE